MWNVQTQDIAQTGNQRTIQYAFLSLSVVQINVLIPVFSSSCSDYNHSSKGTYCTEGKVGKAPVHQIPEAKVYEDKQKTHATELYCSMACNARDAF